MLTASLPAVPYPAEGETFYITKLGSIKTWRQGSVVDVGPNFFTVKYVLPSQRTRHDEIQRDTWEQMWFKGHVKVDKGPHHRNPGEVGGVSQHTGT
jgi:hypothetical protein